MSAAVNENKSAIARAGGIPALVLLLHCRSEEVRGLAAAGLGNLSSLPENRDAMRRAGGIPVLLRLLHSRYYLFLRFRVYGLVLGFCGDGVKGSGISQGF